METDSIHMLIYPNFIQRKRDKGARNDALSICGHFLNRIPIVDKPKCYNGDDDGDYSSRSPYFVRNGIAVVPVFGAMMKGWGYPDQSALAGLMQALKDDSSVRGVLKVFDTPGGSVAGTSDYGDSIAELASVKPVVGYAQDMCASAGMWAASQCHKLFANSTALVGSIGVISMLTDASKMYEDNGVKKIPLVTGKFKAAGEPSQPATKETVDYMQGVIDDLYEPFVSAVNKGRGISKASIKGMEAAVFVGQKAVDNGLVDKICTMDEAFSVCERMANKGTSGKTKAMMTLAESELAAYQNSF